MSKRKSSSPFVADFARALGAKREAAGFPTAYAFFHRRGGRERFGFSYHHYLLLESGKRLQSTEALERIVDALEAYPSTDVATRRRLLQLYLRACVDGSALFDSVLSDPKTQAREPGEPQPQAERILDRVAKDMATTYHRFSDEDTRKIFSNMNAHWVLQLLTTTGAKRTPAQLAADLRIAPGEVERALGILEEVKAVEKSGRGEYFSRFFESGFFFPHERKDQKSVYYWPVADDILKRLKSLDDRTFYVYFCLGIEDEGLISELCDLFKRMTQRASLLSTRKRLARGRMVVAEARIGTLFKLSE